MATTRGAMWAKLDTEVDLLVIGGGITGAGVARDAARRGLSVALIEMNDLAWGTSSRSSKLVHGGLRYLESYEFSLVFEAVSERRILMDLAPHLVNPLGFLFPVYQGSRHKLWYIQAGMWLYDGLSLFRSPKRHRSVGSEELRTLEPSLRQEGLQGAPLYYDCSTDDARLTLETALDAVRHGATVATWSRAERFVHDSQGRIAGVVVRDELGSSRKEIRAGVVVNATGPWTDAVRGMRDTAAPPMLRPTKGVHIVVDRQKLPVDHAVVCLHPDDERVLFAIPWGEQTYLGTTDTDFQGDPGAAHATLADVTYLLEAAGAYFPGCPLAPSDVVSTWAGVRPLVAPPTKGSDVSESAVSREHQITVAPDGLITIAGGKLTTYRRMASEVVDHAVRLLQMTGHSLELTPAETDKAPLPGGEGWPDDDDHDAVAAEVEMTAKGTIDRRTSRLLADTYGMRALGVAERCAADPHLGTPLAPGRAEVLAQVDVAVEEEFAATLGDVLTRRTQLFFRDRDQGLGAADPVGGRLSHLLGWSEDERAGFTAAYGETVAESRRWKRPLS